MLTVVSSRVRRCLGAWELVGVRMLHGEHARESARVPGVDHAVEHARLVWRIGECDIIGVFAERAGEGERVAFEDARRSRAGAARRWRETREGWKASSRRNRRAPRRVRSPRGRAHRFRQRGRVLGRRKLAFNRSSSASRTCSAVGRTRESLGETRSRPANCLSRCACAGRRGWGRGERSAGPDLRLRYGRNGDSPARQRGAKAWSSRSSAEGPRWVGIGDVRSDGAFEPAHVAPRPSLYPT